jgi:uracil-DNA glycosylase
MTDPIHHRLQVLERLHYGIRACTACRLHRTRTQAVPGAGDVSARIMLIGEAPGANEDREGTPFIGRAGRFLDELLTASGLDRSAIYITSAVKCRPPDNRTPKDDEMETCRKLWLERQIELVDPQFIVLLGKAPLRQLFGKRAEAKLSDIHGQVRIREGRRYLLTYHPAAGMRFPIARCAMQEDFRKLLECLRTDADMSSGSGKPRSSGRRGGAGPAI